MTTFYNLARMYTETTGDSDVTLTTAVPGCLTFALAGVPDSEELHYGLITYDTASHRPVGSEAGMGKYISSGTVFQRNTIERSTDSDNSAINLTGLTEIYLCPVASDYNAGFGVPFAAYRQNGVTAINNSATGQMGIDSEEFDDFNLGVLTDSDDKITITNTGWYSIAISLGIYSLSTDFNGYVFAYTNVAVGDLQGFEKRGYVLTQAISSDDFILNMPLVKITSPSTSYIQVSIDNFLGVNIEAYITRVSIFRIGDI